MQTARKSHRSVPESHHSTHEYHYTKSQRNHTTPIGTDSPPCALTPTPNPPPNLTKTITPLISPQLQTPHHHAPRQHTTTSPPRYTTLPTQPNNSNHAPTTLNKLPHTQAARSRPKPLASPEQQTNRPPTHAHQFHTALPAAPHKTTRLSPTPAFDTQSPLHSLTPPPLNPPI
ncbi:protein hunchback-like [Penaeus chinensis]|uniref:protein hunchback-like n=1 Tax=Penaeus chinensis TaxID=139456 RepID=UPI001FB73BF7|nr:protein hunchback-like [Penaeus chinensis]